MPQLLPGAANPFSSGEAEHQSGELALLWKIIFFSLPEILCFAHVMVKFTEYKWLMLGNIQNHCFGVQAKSASLMFR